MTLKSYLIIMILATIFCWSAWWVVIINVDPFQIDLTGLLFFYISLFSAILGTFSIVTFLVRWFFSRSEDPVFRFVKRSFRDAFLIATFVILALYLQAQHYLRWWNLGILAVVFILYILLTYSINISKKDQENTQT